MELDELKKLWKEENQQLEAKLRLREEAIRRMNFDKAVGELDALHSHWIMGRNLALAYCVLSIILSLLIIEDLVYSIPGIIGGLGMLWSFWYHLSNHKIEPYKSSILELQKSICNFRVYSASTAKYDISVTAIWLLTLIPVFLRLVFKIPVYTDPKYLTIFCFISFLGMLILIAVSKKVYKAFDRKLIRIESHLSEIHEFEDNPLNPNEVKVQQSIPKALSILIGLYAVGALLFIAKAGYQFGVWLKGVLD